MQRPDGAWVVVAPSYCAPAPAAPVAVVQPPPRVVARRLSGLPSLSALDLTMPGRAGPRMRGPPNFAERKERACARRFIINARQIRFPRAPLRGASGVLDPARPGMAHPVPSSKQKERDDDRALRPYPGAAAL